MGLAVLFGIALILLRDESPEPRVPVASQAVEGSVRPSSTVGPGPVEEASNPDALTAFASWSQRFIESPSPEMEAEGLRLAAERRPEMKELIRNHPREALRRAVPMVVRQKLPSTITALLEERVNEVGTMRVYQGVPLEGDPLPAGSLTVRVAEMRNGKTYDAHVYGRRAEKVEWTANASLNGVAIDSDFAVNEDPWRPLEIGEIPNEEKPVSSVCPVSGKNAAEPEAAEEPVAEETPAIETATETIFFCDGSHIMLYGETLILGEGSSGGAIGFTGILPAVPTPSIGVVRVLYIPTTYLDQNAVPSTESKSYELLRDVSDFYSKSSFGKLTLVSTVTPPIKLPHTEAWYVQRDTSNGGDIDGEGVSHSHARAAARRLGFDDANYDCVVMRHEGGPGSYGGLGGGSSVWLRGDSVGVLAHEIGHCFGLAHANFWNTAGTSAIGAGTNSEYGDTYDNMGSSGSFPNGHYNAQAKSQVRWLPSNFIQPVNQSGVFRIHAFDQTSLDPSNRYAMTIVKDAQRTYWGEVRSLFTSNPWTQRGMLLGWRFPSGSGSNIQLIDTTPGTPTGNSSKDDAPISLGSTFSDFEAGIHLTAIHVNDAPRYVDMVVNIGDFPANQRPTLSLLASAEVVPVGATVTFTASADDPDGDPLAYSWQHFGDTNYRVVENNSPVITRTFSTAGTYVVSCTASDMKGGSAMKSKLITVGSGNGRFTIQGRITVQGQGLANVIVTANGANGVVTDSDGNYTIPNLTANTYTMSPLLYGYTFGELFQNSVTVGPSFTGADFDASPDATLRIDASVPDASEQAPVTAGRFTLTRTGDTSAALTVNVNSAQGSAGKGTDYNFSPDYVAGSQGFSTFTIPEGESTLDILVQPLADTTPEGPETVTLQLGPGNGYVLAGGTSATVTIADDDTNLPKVSISASGDSLQENTSSPEFVTFTTAAPVSSNLAILYAVSGTATGGADFVALSGSALITAGNRSVTVPVTPVNDAISEPLETLRITTSSNAAYLVDPQASSVSLNLVDDDVQILNVTATDPASAEVDLTVPGAVADTGTFLFTREGDLSAALTVYYAVSGIHATGNAALHGVDYEALPGVLVIPAGQPSASVTILPRHDGIGEGTESVLMQLGAGPTNYVLGSSANALITIADHPNDRPSVEVIPLRSATEGDTSGTFRLSARGSGSSTLQVNFSMGGSATAGSDYTVTTGANLTFNSGTGTGTATLTLANGNPVTMDISIVATNDGLAESLENLVMNLTPSASYNTFAPSSSASMWVRDASQTTVYVDAQVGTSGATMDTITEGATTSPVKFYVSRTGSTASALTVNYSLSGTATAGSDYNSVSGTLTIPAGANGADLPISVINDSAIEGTETILFNFAAGSYAAGNDATIYIADNEIVSQTVSFTGTGSRAAEDAGAVNVPVTLGSAAASPVTVEYIVDTGTRAATQSDVTSVFAPHWVRVERSGSTFRSWRSANGTSWTQIGTNQTMDLPAEVLAGLAVSSRSDGVLSTAVFDSVTFSTPPNGPLQGRTVGFVLAQGEDSEAGGVYTVSGSGAGLNVSSQDECHFLAAPISGDFTLTARVVSQTGGAAAQEAGVMIRESASFRSRAIFSGARGTGGLRMYARTSTFTSALGAGIDHNLTTGQLTFGIGEQTKNITFDLTDDTIVEPNETLMILIRNPNAARLGSITQHAFTIEDNDLPPAEPFVGFARIGSSHGEDSGTVQIAVTLSAPASGTTSVNYAVTGGTAASPSDFTLASGTLVFQEGESVRQIPVTLVDDTAVESAETVVVGLSSPTGAVIGGLSSHTLTITDNDRPVITVTSDVPEAAETGGSGRFIISRSGSTSGSLTVNYAVSGTALSGTDYQSIGTSVVIPDGQSSANVTVTPLPDSTNEGTETVNLTLSGHTSYTVGSPSAATVSILDDDRSTVTLVASDPVASETPGDTGEFTITRTAPTTGSLTVTLTRTGNAANVTDYASISTSVTFTAGQASRTITVTPVDDGLTEGDEVVTLALSSGSYDIGAENFANVTIRDNDLPPTVFISSPSAQGVLLSQDNGLIVSATVEDDGTPQPVAVAWSQASGPGTATFDDPDNTTSGVTFSDPGGYVLRITATDGQFSVSDQIAVEVGPSLASATWIRQDLNPSSARRGDTGLVDGVFTVSGTGAGYGGTSDGAHTVTRHVNGTTSIVARVTSLSGTGTPLTGVTIRDSMWQGSRRAVLGCEPGNGIRFRYRTTASTTDTSVTASLPLPVWLKLERDGGTNLVTASYAPDDGGAPGAWTQLAAPTVTMDADVSVGLTTTSSSTSSIATGVIDKVTLTPAPNGPAVLREDETASSFATPGSSSFDSGTGVYTVAGGSNGSFFHGWQYQGDFMVTARHDDATSGAGSARSGIVIRESSQAGGTAWMGRIPTGSYNGFSWTSVAGGSGSGVPTFTGKLRWVRMIRRGNQIIAFHAPDVAGAPGTWTQVGQPQTVIMTPQVLVGFAVNNASGVGLNTARFSNFSVVPLNTAPFVETSLAGRTPGSATLDGTVTDDGRPSPPGTVSTAWTQVEGPAGVTFDDAGATDTSAHLPSDDAYRLRLIADDGQARTFDDLIIPLSPSEVNLTTNDPEASEAGLDPGGFTVSRAGGSTAAPLSVQLSVGGSATSGEDFTAITIPVVIPAGQASVAIPVDPIQDDLIEADETVNVQILPNAAYLLGATTEASVVIHDDDFAPSLTVTSPKSATASIHSGTGLHLAATLHNAGSTTPVTTWSQVSGPGTAAFADASALHTTVRFSADGAYALKLSATGGIEDAHTIVRVRVGLGPADAPVDQDIATPSDGSGFRGEESHTLYGSGAGLGENSDQLHFLGEPITGDFDIRARLTSKSSQNQNALAAVMARESLAADSAHLTIAHEASSIVRLHSRESTAGTTVNGIGGALDQSVPAWLRLYRNGANFEASVSSDGITWTKRERSLASLPATLQVGFVAANGSTNPLDPPLEAIFSEVGGLMTGNHASQVDAGPSVVVLPGTASVPGASIEDDGRPLIPGTLSVLWEQVSGPGTVVFDEPDSLFSSRTFPVTGTYVLRLTADDGAARTFDETTVIVTDSPYEIWRFQRFGSDFANDAISGPASDPEGDGLDNLLEFATGTDPNSHGNSAFVFTIAEIAGERYQRLTITRNPAANDVNLSVEAGGNLSGWSGANLVIETNTPTQLIVRDSVPVSGAATRFMRVRASQ